MTRTTELVLAEAGGSPAPLTVAAVPVAEGGDATIHPVQGRPEWVAKLYRDPASEARRRAKLEAMLAAPPAGREVEHGGRRSVQLAWPTALVERDGATDGPPAGFVMPRVHLEEAVVLEQLLSGRARRAAGLPDGVRLRVSAARNLAAVVAALHAEGHHVIDLKPSNVHVYRDTAFVAVLDCDGFSVAGPDGARFPAHQYTDGYIAPEALRARAKPEDLGEDQDRFALAVVVFRLLNRGLHPFQGVPAKGAAVPTTDGERVAAGLYPYGSGFRTLSPPPASLHGSFDTETRGLFARAFDGPKTNRPSAAEWAEHLSSLLAASGLRPCPQSPDHAVYPGVEECGVCGQGARPTPRPAAPPASAPTWTPVARPSGLLSSKGGYIGALVALSVAWFFAFRVLFGGGPSEDADEVVYAYSDYEIAAAPPEPYPVPDVAEPSPAEDVDVEPELVGGFQALLDRTDYPELARQAGVTGIVTVSVTADRVKGPPLEVRALRRGVLRAPRESSARARDDQRAGSRSRSGRPRVGVLARDRGRRAGRGAVVRSRRVRVRASRRTPLTARRAPLARAVRRAGSAGLLGYG